MNSLVTREQVAAEISSVEIIKFEAYFGISTDWGADARDFEKALRERMSDIDQKESLLRRSLAVRVFFQYQDRKKQIGLCYSDKILRKKILKLINIKYTLDDVAGGASRTAMDKLLDEIHSKASLFILEVDVQELFKNSAHFLSRTRASTASDHYVRAVQEIRKNLLHGAKDLSLEDLTLEDLTDLWKEIHVEVVMKS